jgi:hypothetical protein
MMHPALEISVKSPRFGWYEISLEQVLPGFVGGHHKFVSHDFEQPRKPLRPATGAAGLTC